MSSLRRLSPAVLSIVAFAALGAYLAANSLAQGKNPKNVVGKAPPIIAPGTNGAPPSDAIVLFDGKNLDEWETRKSEPAGWKVEDGVMSVPTGQQKKDDPGLRGGDMRTKRKFGDIQLHLEWRSPMRKRAVDGKGGENLGNSGIKFHEAYEVQILDSYQLDPHRPTGMAGAVYKQHVPLVNACRAPGEWQTYDIVFRAPWFDEKGKILRHGTVTVLHNGVLIQDNVTVWGRTNSNAPDPKDYRNSFFLQDHGAPVSYRNVWVRELERIPLEKDAG